MNPKDWCKMGLKLIIFGASGMVGQGALREALADPEVTSVLSVGRRACGVQHPKLIEALTPDLMDLSPLEAQLQGWDACLWAVGVSSLGQSEADYDLLTRRLTLTVAQRLLALNPGLSFCYCSAAGADGNSMWARVRRRLEQELLAMPFTHVGCVRPALIQPGKGIKSRTPLYQALISLLSWTFPFFVRHFPKHATTSERLGRAMLGVVKGQAGLSILESADINRLGH